MSRLNVMVTLNGEYHPSGDWPSHRAAGLMVGNYARILYGWLTIAKGFDKSDYVPAIVN